MVASATQHAHSVHLAPAVGRHRYAAVVLVTAVQVDQALGIAVAAIVAAASAGQDLAAAVVDLAAEGK